MIFGNEIAIPLACIRCYMAIRDVSSLTLQEPPLNHLDFSILSPNLQARETK
jgi:hypothetical protein